jgi:hypothetical protein
MLWVLDKRLIAVTSLAGSLLWGAAANAQTVSIGLNGVQIGASFSGASPLGGNASGSSGNFSVNVGATGFPGLGFGSPIPLLFGDAIAVNSIGAGTATIAITEQGLLTLPSTFGTFTSTYTVNSLSGSLTVTEQTYYDAANGKFTTPTALGAGLVGATAPTVVGPNNSANIALSADFSVTELFTIVATAAGRTNDTINLGVDVTSGSIGTPLPAALPMLGSVLGGGFLFGRLRNRRKARAQLAAV